MTFPRLSEEPLEQFLIEEAVMTAYYSEIAANEAREAARQRAREKAEAMLGRHRER